MNAPTNAKVSGQTSVPRTLKIGLIAHDNKKPDLVAWAKRHRDFLKAHQLVGTGTTGGLVERETGLPIEKMLSGPRGGDLQIGARVAEGNLDALVFFWDPLSPHPHDVDVRALLRACVLHNVPLACNAATADFLLKGMGSQPT